MQVLQVRSTLEEYFGSCGEISRVSIPKDYESGGVKGCVFLLYINAFCPCHIEINKSTQIYYAF